MATTPRVSVVIPAWNAERFLDDTLRSVEQQSFQDFEIVVVDDGSTDRSIEIVRAHPRARLIERQRGGPAAARNAGVAASGGELVAFLDADDGWHPGKLGLQVESLDREPRSVLSSTLHETWEGQPTGRVLPLVGMATSAILADSYVGPSSVVLRRRAFDAAGGFDPDPRLISVEDLDLWLRLSVLGPFTAVPQRLTRRRLHADNLSRDSVELYRRMVLVLDKFAGLPEGRPFADALARRKAELLYLAGRGELSRGHLAEARAELRRARAAAPALRARCLALEALSRLPASWLGALQRSRERSRERDRARQGEATSAEPGTTATAGRGR